MSDSTTGSPNASPNGSSANGNRLAPEYEQAKQRAEILLNEWGQRLSVWAAALGGEMQKAAARAREEAEDIWAEAQALRDENVTPPS